MLVCVLKSLEDAVTYVVIELGSQIHSRNEDIVSHIILGLGGYSAEIRGDADVGGTRHVATFIWSAKGVAKMGMYITYKLAWWFQTGLDKSPPRASIKISFLSNSNTT